MFPLYSHPNHHNAKRRPPPLSARRLASAPLSPAPIRSDRRKAAHVSIASPSFGFSYHGAASVKSTAIRHNSLRSAQQALISGSPPRKGALDSCLHAPWWSKRLSIPLRNKKRQRFSSPNGICLRRIPWGETEPRPATPRPRKEHKKKMKSLLHSIRQCRIVNY